MTLQEQVIKRFCDFIKGSCSLYGTTMPSLIAIVIVVVEMSWDLARPHDQRVSDFTEGISSLNVTTLPGLVVVEMFFIYYVASCDHIFKGLSNFVGGSIS